MGKLLRERFGGESLPADHIRNRAGAIVVQKKHNTLDQLRKHSVLTAEEEAEWLKFTTVRNPFDVLVTLYTRRRSMTDEYLRAESIFWINENEANRRDLEYCRTHTFDEWIGWRYPRRGIFGSLGAGRKSMSDRYTNGVDVVMRFDTLEEDLNKVFQRVGVTDPVTLPVYNKTGGRNPDYRAYYNDKSRRIVERVFRADLERYGYSF